MYPVWVPNKSNSCNNKLKAMLNFSPDNYSSPIRQDLLTIYIKQNSSSTILGNNGQVTNSHMNIPCVLKMSSETIIETRKDNIKIVRLNKPRRKNAIDYQMYVRLTKILNDAATDNSISMIVLTGTGDFYCSGNDLVASAESDFLTILENFIKAFITFPKLLISIVNGPAVGVAVTTLPLCDFVFASENAYFYTPFTKLNIIGEGCSTFTFPKLIGPRKAMDLLLLNYKMPAREALECGLISYLYKTEELQHKAWEKITEISNLPEHSVLTTKRLFRRTYMEELLETNMIEIKELKKISASRSKL